MALHPANFTVISLSLMPSLLNNRSISGQSSAALWGVFFLVKVTLDRSQTVVSVALALLEVVEHVLAGHDISGECAGLVAAKPVTNGLKQTSFLPIAAPNPSSKSV